MKRGWSHQTCVPIESSITSTYLSTLPNNQFGPMTGTSMAAPMLSGILVELLARRKTNIPIRRLMDVFAEHAKEVNAENQTQHSPFDGYVFVKLYKPMHQ